MTEPLLFSSDNTMLVPSAEPYTMVPIDNAAPRSMVSPGRNPRIEPAKCWILSILSVSPDTPSAKAYKAEK